MKRSILESVTRLAAEKFVLISGPRQVGKTTLARAWLNDKKGVYWNWDIPTDREAILRYFKTQPHGEALVLDEIHKYDRWKSWLKGLYDRDSTRLQVVVTGSARMDLFQKGGDSLVGRYNLVRLHPLTLGEVSGTGIPPSVPHGMDWRNFPVRPVDRSLWELLMRRGGFPEPFLKDEDTHHRRWALRRRQLLVEEDIRSLTDIRNLTLVEHLALLLPERVGSLLSLNALREELQTAHGTVSSWIEALERIYFCFQITPYSRKIARSLKKEKKMYFWDWSQVPDPGARFENIVASHLLKSVHLWTDLGYGEFDLHYWRDREKREVDFVITEQRKPVAAIECRMSDDTPSPHLEYFNRQHGGGIPMIQLVEKSGVDERCGQIRIVSADAWLANFA